MQSRIEPAALFALALLSIIWAWWATKAGAYFPDVLLPGTIVLCIGACMLAGLAPWRARLSLSKPTAVALAALAGLALWSLLSAFWSPAPDVAIEDAQRIFVYALAFGLGLWLCNLLGMRMELALVPIVAAAAFAAGAAIIALLGVDEPRELFEGDGTLDYPLGYRNENAAFFLIAFFPALALAMRRELDWRLRGLALATASVGLDLAALSQSRASLPAFAVALLVYALLSPYRVRALSWLALAALPALLLAPAIGSVYSAANDEGIRAAGDEIQTAGMLLALIALGAVALGAAAARYEARIPGLRAAHERSNRNVARAILAIAGICLIGFLAAVGDPVDWVGQKADEFRSSGTPDSSESGSRFSFNAGSNRYDLWRVALDDFADDPIRGSGAGGYQYTYLEKRESQSQTAHDAHSVELELLAELGLPGLALLLCVVVGAGLGAAQARRLGPAAAGLVAACLASAAYWLAHSSIDWFWPYPAVTAPAMMLLGVACGPAVLALESDRPVWWRPWLITGLVALALTAIPLWLSERYVDSASSVWQQDLDQGYSDLDTAQSLNPFSDWPILVEGEIARQAGDTDRATDAFLRAVAERPAEYAGHYRLAELTREENPEFAREQISEALALNPIDRRVRALAERLGVEPEPLPD
jgi:O-antigen ligase